MDSASVRDAQFNAAEITRLQADPEYDYDRSLHVENLWWDRLLKWVRQQLDDLFGTKGGRWVASHWHWAIVAAAMLLLLFYLRKRLFHGAFTVDADKPRQVLEIHEDLAVVDLDQLLATAEREGNWRLALRYHYLKVLRRLMDEGRIRLKPESTDGDYLRQLKDPAQRSTFAELSFLFKWAWYGDAPLDEARYRSLAPAFTLFHTPGTA
ncbi:MAG: DUF4129 domain-containing protein [Flavobacteriales bacterium]|nr:DUF4129 domain-containing protein [Flavobacteriales bacterium]MBP9080563.1 DUF4129 domain-containing protein [Flavobacteriales bacterium]